MRQAALPAAEGSPPCPPDRHSFVSSACHRVRRRFGCANVGSGLSYRWPAAIVVRAKSLTSGVLSGPRNRLIALLWGLRGWLPRKTGYAVDANEAVRILEQTSPVAAAWWRDNVPRLQHRRRKFLFAPSACEIVTEAA